MDLRWDTSVEAVEFPIRYEPHGIPPYVHKYLHIFFNLNQMVTNTWLFLVQKINYLGLELTLNFKLILLKCKPKQLFFYIK